MPSSAWIIPIVLAGYAQAAAQNMTEDFSNGLANWWVEGGERAWLQDGRLHLWAENGAAPGRGAATVWWKRPLPADFVLSLDAQVLSSPAEANNINLFLSYADPSGTPLFDTRAKRESAEYNLYHQMNGYIITFLNDAKAEGGRNPDGSTRARVRIRRNPGFQLLKETFAKSCRRGVTYRLTVTKRGRRIGFAVDGETLLEAEDAHPWPGGLLALRTFGTYLWWDSIRVEPPPIPAPR